LRFEAGVEGRAAEYATPEEIAALKADLRKRWKQLGSKMRDADLSGMSFGEEGHRDGHPDRHG